MLIPGSSEQFVGRETELEQLSRSFDETQEGQGSIALVAGEPGIGKTVLINQLAEYASSNGANTLVGLCSEDEGAPPYWPWVQALRRYFEEYDPDTLKDQLGTGGPLIAEAVPDIRSRLPELPQLDPDPNPESARFRLFDAMEQFFHRAARAGPILLIFEDLHWADEPTLRLLAFMSRRLDRAPLMIVGSYLDVEIRRTHALYRVLGEITSERRFVRVSLRGWNEEDTARYLEAAGGGALPKSMVLDLYERTRGTPLFVAEVTRLLADEGRFRPGSGPADLPLRIPEGVKEAIGRRLDRLSDNCNKLLAIASVVGPRFSAHVLERLSITENLPIYESLDEAAEANIIEASVANPGHFSFRHALVHQTVLEEIPAILRARRHGEVGIALETLYGTASDNHAAEIAHYFEQAGELGDTNKLVHYASVAGNLALSAFGYEEAKNHFEHALVPLGDENKSMETARLWYGLGLACLGLGDFIRNHECLERAFDICDSHGEHDLAVEIALSQFLLTDDRLLRRALEMVDPKAANRADILAKMAPWSAEFGGNEAEIEAALLEASQISERLGDSRLIATVLMARCEYDRRCGRDADLEAAERCVALAEEVGESQLKLSAYTSVQAVFRSHGRIKQALEMSQRAIALGERTGDRWLLGRATVNHFDLLLDLGELRKSREVDDRILEWFPDDFYLVARRVDLELLSGDLAAAEVYLAKFISIIDKSAPGVGSPRRFIPYWKSAILFTLWSFFTGRDDLLGRAEESARFVLGSPDAARGGRWLALTGLAWVSMIRADAGMASRCYADLLELDNEYASRGAGRDMVLGMTAAIAGINEKAQYHLAIAWEEPDKGHSVITRVATGFHYGNFLMSHGNADAARPVIADAIREAERCEMLLWVEKLRSLRPGGSTDAPRHRSDGLTDREVEVLRLVAVGMTDKEIGSRLFISPKTVGNHVTHIREKTRTRNRVEIARYATERGLLTN